MNSQAPLSPATRGKQGLMDRAQRLEAFETWAQCKPLNVEAIVEPDLWRRYFEAQENILAQMRQAQELSHHVRAQILASHRSDASPV